MPHDTAYPPQDAVFPILDLFKPFIHYLDSILESNSSYFSACSLIARHRSVIDGL